MTTTNEKLCVTYSYAYVRGEITLCAECADLPDETPLGEVRHGERLVVCDACERRDIEAEEAADVSDAADAHLRGSGITLTADSNADDLVDTGEAWGHGGEERRAAVRDELARRIEAARLDAQREADAEAACDAIGLDARIADAINESARQDGAQVALPVAPEDFDAA
jgi:hypothetical protein